MKDLSKNDALFKGFVKIVLFLHFKRIYMSISIQKFTFNGFQENTYIVHDGTNCVIIDPGCIEKSEEEDLVGFIQKMNLTPKALLLTHAHIDHVLGCNFILNKYGVDFYIHEKDINTLEAVQSYAHVYGFPSYIPPKTPNKLLKGGEILTFGDISLEVLFTPGHCVGHVVYYNKENSFVINGDVLFAGSFGRVDLPGGDLEVLKDSIFNTMFNLPEDTIVYCGHGTETTIKQEKLTNYILQY
jgi:glyoxylase-like metal-dependent hydrolase (beta-lactamase superfamily II)